MMEIPRKMPIIDLVKLMVRLRYEKYLPERKKAIITRAGQKYGLLDEEGKPTAYYFALMNDDVEKLATELTGWPAKRLAGQCPCGCGRFLKGKAKYATQACQKRAWRRDRGQEITDVRVKQKSGLEVAEFATEKNGKIGGLGYPTDYPAKSDMGTV
jgi:hypothetical protein